MTREERDRELDAPTSLERCTACGWQGDGLDLCPDDNDLCQACGRRGFMTTVYGPLELRAWELEAEQHEGEAGR